MFGIWQCQIIFEYSNILSQNIIIYFIIILHGNKHKGVCDIVFFFDGASNSPNAYKILLARNPHIIVGHGAEHVVSLFFSNVFLKIPSFATCLVLQGIQPRQCSKSTKKQNNGIKVRFINPSDFRYISYFNGKTSIIFVSHKFLSLPSLQLHSM